MTRLDVDDQMDPLASQGIARLAAYAGDPNQVPLEELAASCVEAGEPTRNWCLACASDCPEDCSTYGPEEVY